MQDKKPERGAVGFCVDRSPPRPLGLFLVFIDDTRDTPTTSRIDSPFENRKFTAQSNQSARNKIGMKIVISIVEVADLG